MKIEIMIATQTIRDAIESGIHGGIQYWADVLEWRLPTQAIDEAAVDPNVVCVLRERDGGKVYSLQGRWLLALQIMATAYPKTFGQILRDSSDANSGDVLIQLAMFGELRYG